MNRFKDIQKERKTYYSQNGEEGVIEFIFKKIPVNGWAVEFGAWDGKYLSNTYFLIEKKNYHGVFIEGDSDKMPHLIKTMESFSDKTTCINTYVKATGEDSLDNILKKTKIPYDFDLLSIDIDGNDYYVWESFINFKPKVVIIEINIKSKPEEFVINDPESKFEWGKTGTSLKAYAELAKRKGYALLANVSCNAIFIDQKYLDLFFNKEPSPEEVFTYEGFDLSELTLKEALRKSQSAFWKKLVRLPWHMIRKM
jgi:hypothetical protein